MSSLSMVLIKRGVQLFVKAASSDDVLAVVHTQLKRLSVPDTDSRSAREDANVLRGKIGSHVKSEGLSLLFKIAESLGTLGEQLCKSFAENEIVKYVHSVYFSNAGIV